MNDTQQDENEQNDNIYEDKETNMNKDKDIQSETPVYTESEVEAENSLVNGNMVLNFNVSDNVLYITKATTNVSGENFMAESSPYALPKSFQTEKQSKETFDLNWVYNSTVRFENKETNGVMTSGLIYNFDEPEQNLKLQVFCIVRDGIDGPFELYTQIENLNDFEFRIAPYEFATFTVNIPDPDSTYLMQIKREGSLAEGFQFSKADDNFDKGTGIYTTPFSQIKKLTSSAKTDGNEDWLLAQYIDINGEKGIFYALEWTNGNLRVQNNNDGTATINANMDMAGKYTRFFTTEIPSKETLILPSVYFMPYEGSVDDGSVLFRHWFFECKTPSKLRDNPEEPLTQIDEQMEIHDVVEANIDSIKKDYGWWSNVNFFQTSNRPYEGSWVLLADEKDTPGFTFEQMKNTGDYCKEFGVNLTVYILLHDTQDPDGNVTDQYGEFNSLSHPEWFSHETNCSNKLADLGNTEVVEFLKNKLETVFNLTGIRTWRTDFQPIVSESDKENRHDSKGTDVMYWATLGFNEILDHLYDTVEGFRYECCDSGGNSKSLYMAKQAVVFNVEDSATYINLRAAFYDSTYVFHPSQLQMPCNIASFNTESEEYFFPEIPEPETEDGDEFDFYDTMQNMGFRTTVMGVPHWAPWDGNVLPDYYKEYCDMYENKIRPLVRNGELYHILPRPDGVNWDGMMYADPDSENEIKGLVFLFKPSQDTTDIQNVVFKGLDKDTVYNLTFEDRPQQNTSATGEELMTNGINVEIKYVGSELIWITEAK